MQCNSLFKACLVVDSVCVAWAKLEVSMEDRVEVFLDDVAEIPCIYNMSGSASSPTIQWFAVSQIFRYVLIAFLWNIVDIRTLKKAFLLSCTGDTNAIFIYIYLNLF